MAGRPVVIALEDRLAGYLAMRRALGYRLARAEKLLAQLIAWMNERGEETITIAWVCPMKCVWSW